jgi:hypothetical protein
MGYAGKESKVKKGDVRVRLENDKAGYERHDAIQISGLAFAFSNIYEYRFDYRHRKVHGLDHALSLSIEAVGLGRKLASSAETTDATIWREAI